jgi:hypothetical protein
MSIILKNKYLFWGIIALFFISDINTATAMYADPIDTCWYIVRKDGKKARFTYGKIFCDKNDTALYYTRSSSFKKKKKKEDFEHQIPLSNVSQIKNCMGAVFYQDTTFKTVAQGKLRRRWYLFQGYRYAFDNIEIPEDLFWQHIQACLPESRKIIKVLNTITIAFWIGYLLGALLLLTVAIAGYILLLIGLIIYLGRIIILDKAIKTYNKKQGY